METEKKINVALLKQKSQEEIGVFFNDLIRKKQLHVDDELVMLKMAPMSTVQSYVKLYNFSSEKSEIEFIKRAPIKLRKSYIDYYGLYWKTQKYVIDHNLSEIAYDFMLTRRFDDELYLITSKQGGIIHAYIKIYTLKETLVLQLVNYENENMICSYINNLHYISDNVKNEIVRQKKYSAFFHLMRIFREKFYELSPSATNYQQLIAEKLADYYLPVSLQIELINNWDKNFADSLMRSIPLVPEVQRLIFKNKIDADMLLVHTSSLYGKANYCFEADEEEQLFNILVKKGYENSLTSVRLKNEETFFQIASSNAIRKYFLKFWPTDEGQLVIMKRRNPSLVKELINLCTPDHGLCWEAEVLMVKIYNEDVLNAYISFHTLCSEALEILKKKKPEIHNFYFTKHQF